MEDPQAEFLALERSDDGPKERMRGHYPAVGIPGWGGTRTEVFASHDGLQRWVHAGWNGETYEVHHQTVEGETLGRVELSPGVLTGLHLLSNGWLVLGRDEQICALDMTDPHAVPTVVHRRDQPTKPPPMASHRNIFARDRSRLLVDEDLFSMVPMVGLVHLGSTGIPERNGYSHWSAAFAAGDAPDGPGVLFVLDGFTAERNTDSEHYGHELAAFTMPGGRARQTVAERHYRSTERQQLLVGNEWTAWQRIAWVGTDGGGLVLAAAAERGLLSISDELDASTVQVLELEPPVWDVRVDGTAVWVLRGDSDRELVELDAHRLQPVHRIALGPHYVRFM